MRLFLAKAAGFGELLLLLAGGLLYYYPMFEPAHFVMEAGMMLGIKARAEAMTPSTALGHTTLEVAP